MQCIQFGHNGFGNLGNGEHSEYGDGICVPYQLKLNKKFKSVSCGKQHNMLLTETNEVRCSVTHLWNADLILKYHKS